MWDQQTSMDQQSYAVPLHQRVRETVLDGEMQQELFDYGSLS